MKVVNDKNRALGEMMKPISNTLAALVILIMTLGGSPAMGAITASVDRDRVALGDTVRLTIITTENEKLKDADLRDLTENFEIIGRSTNNSTSIVNGRMSQTRKVIIDLMPRRAGSLYVPSIRMGQNSTQSIRIQVSPAPTAPTGEQTVVFEAEVDKDSVYVQGQVILTLRIQQSINLDGGNISELKLDNAFVKPLEQHSFQRNIDGRPWRVNEVRYAIFPEKSGTLEIPAQVFSGRASRGRQSVFDLGGGGQLLRRNSKPISINVLPKPSSFTADTWLPTQSLTLQETWSSEPNELRVGESATRTITIVGEGLQGAQLPPILFTPIDGLKYYPDQPTIEDQELTDGLVGIRQDSAAVVPVRSGTYQIPEIRIPWWNTQTEQLEYAVLPERDITVAAAEITDLTTEPVPPATPIDIAATPLTNPTRHSLGGPVWPIVSAISTLGWTLTLLYLWRARRSTAPNKPHAPDTSAEKQVFKQLLAVCADNNAARTRGAIIDWIAAFKPKASPVSLDEVAKLFEDEEFTREIDTLNTCLYSSDQDHWDGTSLADCLRRLRRAGGNEGAKTGERIKLYPNGN
jgi:hypothetical protein